jgi:hypothetical protein
MSLKTITLINWSLLVIYGLVLTITVLTLKQSGTDAAGRGIASAYLFFGFILLGVVLLINFLPFYFSRIAVLILLILPVFGGVGTLIRQLMTSQKSQKDEMGRIDGSFYFHDSERQQIAQAIYERDKSRLQALLKQPVPKLNDSGEDHVTLLDFATIQGVLAGNPEELLPYLELLMSKGATIETADLLHVPAHALVIRECSIGFLDWFLQKGANPNAKHPKRDNAAILFAVMDCPIDRLEKLKSLLKHGADPNVIYPATASSWLAGHSALLAAARMDLWDSCTLLLENGADPAVEGPQHLIFQEFIHRRAEIYAAEGSTPDTFTTLVKSLKK